MAGRRPPCPGRRARRGDPGIAAMRSEWNDADPAHSPATRPPRRLPRLRHHRSGGVPRCPHGDAPAGRSLRCMGACAHRQRMRPALPRWDASAHGGSAPMTTRRDQNSRRRPGQGGALQRRQLLGATLGAALAPAVLRAQGTAPGTAQGAARAGAVPDLKGRTVVFASYGGAYQDAERQSLLRPLRAGHGGTRGAGRPGEPREVPRHDGGRHPGLGRGGRHDRLPVRGRAGEPVRADRPGAGGHLAAWRRRIVNAHGVGCIVWSYNVGFGTTAYPGGTAAAHLGGRVRPASGFPGGAPFADEPVATLEAALLADGVAPDALYPLDVERALRRSSAPSRAQTVFWGHQLAEPAAVRGRRGGGWA